VRFSFIDHSYKCRIKAPRQYCGDVFRTSLFLFLVQYNFTTNLGSWGRFGLTGHAEDDAALAGRKQGDRLLVKGDDIVLLGFRLNPRDDSILLTRSHSSQEPGACQEVQTVSFPNVSCAIASMSRVDPALQFILFDPKEYTSDCLSRSHKTKASSLSSFSPWGSW